MLKNRDATETGVIDLGGGVGAKIILRGEETAGRLAVVVHPFEPGGLIEPHTHALEDEWTYVLAGSVTAQIGDDVVELSAGDHIYKPRSVEHAVWNAGDQPARVLEVIAPAGFEHFFEEAAGLVGPDGSFAEADFVQLAERYAMSFAFEKAAAIVRGFGLDRHR